MLGGLEEFEVSDARDKAVQPGESADESTRHVRDERIELAKTDEEIVIVNSLSTDLVLRVYK